jgi:TonB family protein
MDGNRVYLDLTSYLGSMMWFDACAFYFHTRRVGVRKTTASGAIMRLVLASLLLLSILPVDEPANREAVATHVESLGYPDLARQTAIQGSVKVEIIISGDGRISSARAVSGHPLLKQDVEKNIKTWRFTPSSGGDRQLTVTYEFRLELPKTYYRPESQNAFELPARVTVTSNLPDPQP